MQNTSWCPELEVVRHDMCMQLLPYCSFIQWKFYTSPRTPPSVISFYTMNANLANRHILLFTSQFIAEEQY